LFDLYDVQTVNVNGSLIIVVNKVIIKALVLDLFQDARIVHLRRRHQKRSERLAGPCGLQPTMKNGRMSLKQGTGSGTKGDGTAKDTLSLG
jgi:hypothetical protein